MEPEMNELSRVENQARLANKQEILVAAKKQLYQTSWLNIKVNQWKLWLMSCERKRAAARELHLHLFSCLSYLVGFFCFVLVRQFQCSRFWTFPLLFSMHVFHWKLQLCLFNSTVRWCSLRMFRVFFSLYRVSFTAFSTPDTIRYAEAETGCER